MLDNLHEETALKSGDDSDGQVIVRWYVLVRVSPQRVSYE